MKQKIIIIYNPISGARHGIDLPKLIEQHLDKTKYDYEIWTSSSAENMRELCEKAPQTDADIIIAAGGDGTVNQVSEKLINTNKKFYIIPLGSGNGFARHLGIPMNTVKAIKKLSENLKTINASTAKMDDKHFINVAGVGFDAHISHVFANATQRGFWGYFKAIIKELGYKSEEYKVSAGEEKWNGKAFLISVANASQWGNNVVIAPHADLEDEILDVIIIKKFKLIEAPLVFVKILTKNIKTGRYFKLISGTDITIERENPGTAHIDGEPIFAGDKIHFQCFGRIKVLS